MISQDKGKTMLDGSPSLLVSELGALVHYAAKSISENTSMKYDAVISNIMNGASVYKLTEAGMTQEEAMDTLGMKDRIRKSVQINPDGTEEVTYEEDK